MSPRGLLAVAATALLSLAASAVAAAPDHGTPRGARDFDPAEALRYSQAAVGRAVGDYSFRDRQGRSVKLSSYLGKPVVISLIYTSCSHVCPMITQTLDRVVGMGQKALGAEKFNVLTIGFDTRNDTPDRMRRYAVDQGVRLPGWEFLSADAATIERLAADLGFLYFPTAGGFDHLSQVSVLDADGRLYRQVYGEVFEPPLLVEPLKQLVYGNRVDATLLTDLVGRIKLFCTVYDPLTKDYRIDYSIFIEIAIGLVTTLVIGVMLAREWRRRNTTISRAS